jgi:hypothetical protein
MKTPHVIDSGKPGPVMLICAGVHGDEYEPVMATYELVKILTGSIVAGKLIIVPFVNGTAIAAHSRYGEDGLDLARVCPGDPHGSPTLQDAAQISDLIRSSDYLIDMHTGGKIFDIFPMAGYMIHPDPEMLDTQRKMARAFGLPVMWGTEPGPNGRTLSVARDANVPSIYVEYGGGTTARKEIVSAYVSGCLNILAMLNMTDARYREPEPVQQWIEDATPAKGHLQSKMPSPCNGIFCPQVKLGDLVKDGDPWGQVVDIQTGNSTPILAEDTGMVLFLRCDAVVKAGDSLGGIMAINSKTVRGYEQ